VPHVRSQGGRRGRTVSIEISEASAHEGGGHCQVVGL